MAKVPDEVGSGVPEWLERLAREHRGQDPSRLGAVRHIDAATRRRAIGAVTKHEIVTLGREVVASRALDAANRPAVHLDVTYTESGHLTVGTDIVEIACHGTENTHLDSLNHIGVDGAWYGGTPCSVDPATGPSLIDWASTGMVTRAVLADIPSVRGTPWVELGKPVTGAEIGQALLEGGVTIEPGDALLLYMGRDAFERAGNEFLPLADSPAGRPGIGADGARWIASHGISIVCWDLLDAHQPGEDVMSVHMLIWAIGLAVIDNCDLTDARRALSLKDQAAGLLTVAPPKLPGATGSLVNPTLLY